MITTFHYSLTGYGTAHPEPKSTSLASVSATAIPCVTNKKEDLPAGTKKQKSGSYLLSGDDEFIDEKSLTKSLNFDDDRFVDWKSLTNSLNDDDDEFADDCSDDEFVDGIVELRRRR